jgi:hypothetical protein
MVGEGVVHRRNDSGRAGEGQWNRVRLPGNTSPEGQRVFTS